MEKGTVARWNAKAGQEISSGTVVAEIETDKAVLEFEYTGDDAILGTIIADEGATVPVTAPIAVLCSEKSEIPETKQRAEEEAAAATGGNAAPEAAPASQETPASVAAPATPGQSQPTAPPEPQQSSGVGTVPAKGSSPYARKLAGVLGVDLSTLRASAPDGVIVAGDVLAAAPSGGARPQAQQVASPPIGGLDGAYEDIRITTARRTIATRLTQSKAELPHFYVCADVRVATANQLVRAVNDAIRNDFAIGTRGLIDTTRYDPEAESAPVKVTLTALIIRASAVACSKIPEVNSSWLETEGVVRRHSRVDVNCAVATPTGLVAPIIFNADMKGLSEIAGSLKALSVRARAGKLDRSEYDGGTFTVSNLGGPRSVVKQFTAVINPPQVCILAIGATQRPRGLEDDATPLGQGKHDFMTVTLSCDHRVVDGAVGGEWLKQFTKYFEDPVQLLV